MNRPKERIKTHEERGDWHGVIESRLLEIEEQRRRMKMSFAPQLKLEMEMWIVSCERDIAAALTRLDWEAKRTVSN